MSVTIVHRVVRVHDAAQFSELAAVAGAAVGGRIDGPAQALAVAKWVRSLPPAMDTELDGLAFARAWAGEANLRCLVEGELGHLTSGTAAYPVGVVGHWPASNAPTQPLLSAICGLLGGNGCLVRVPTDLVAVYDRLLAGRPVDEGRDGVAGRLVFVSFPSDRADLQAAMAASVDGAMIWGGAKAVRAVRRLPFPTHARLAVFRAAGLSCAD